MQDQKAYHTRKLAIIEMIEECERRIIDECNFIKRFNRFNLMGTMNNSHTNIDRYKKISMYLTIRYNRN